MRMQRLETWRIQRLGRALPAPYTIYITQHGCRDRYCDERTVAVTWSPGCPNGSPLTKGGDEGR